MSALKPASSIDFLNAAPARTQFCEVLAGRATPMRSPFLMVLLLLPASSDEPRAEQPLRARPAMSARLRPATI